MSEHVPTLFRGETAADAIAAAKAWARSEGLVLRTVASARPRDGAPGLWDVVLVVRDLHPDRLLPEPPTL